LKAIPAPCTPAREWYWYATQLNDFGEAIGSSSASKLRKDDLERAIKSFLVTGKAKNPTKRNLSTSGIKEVEPGRQPKARRSRKFFHGYQCASAIVAPA